jgi:hypothetical protein
MTDEIAASLLHEAEKAKSDRGTFETHWQEIAERLLPRYGDFTRTITKGEKLQERVIDAGPAQALDRFAAAMESMLVPQGSTWHRLRADDRELMKIHSVKVYFDELNEALVRTRQQSRFQSQAHEHFLQIGAFGTSGMLVMPRGAKGIYYKTMPLSRFFIKENEFGEIDCCYRKWEWTAAQAAGEWGYEKLPESLQSDIQANKNQEYDFWQIVKPREMVDPQRKDAAGMPYQSWTVFAKEKTVMDEGGFREWPIPTSRYTTSAGETYGRSVAMTALPDIKMLNEMNKTVMRAAHKATDPPLLLHDDMMGLPIRMRPNALNFGGVNSDGRQMIQPLQTGANPGLGVDMMQGKREIINDIFLVTLFQILVDGPNSMTATEVLERAREKGQLLAPAMGRQQYELLDPLIKRELDILDSQGQLPEVPPELQEAGSDYAIVYDSPLSRAQQAEQAAGLFRTLEGITPIAQTQPEVLDRFDWDQITVDLADINAMPSKWLLSDEELGAIKEARAQAQQAQQLLQAAPVVADAEKTVAETQQIAQSGGAGRL